MSLKFTIERKPSKVFPIAVGVALIGTALVALGHAFHLF